MSILTIKSLQHEIFTDETIGTWLAMESVQVYIHGFLDGRVILFL